MTPEKLCVFCLHYEWEQPYHYSTMTAGGGCFSCRKGHHEAYFDGGADSLDEYRKSILFAGQCPDYTQVKP